ncbi:hypothetical protein K437DRAFT_14798 [Tilletiaria anomala UBC 951]|uniref:Uncharacterized protein n=1 Tax=Tilletiaria anomala (strain ATCC 24038 / CBS 436.72 / UBC 951) TaxID=1037660 RepID=A0A066VFK2_TILAU|nr:uncharacterized protein K437DRAFT_14798 [Tilletiaria anomala UBC 951]KDN39088.1 hypothetical protein K437DRAFT_14798 [Tilletiaria anomala UBC 951]
MPFYQQATCPIGRANQPMRRINQIHPPNCPPSAHHHCTAPTVPHHVSSTIQFGLRAYSVSDCRDHLYSPVCELRWVWRGLA